MDITSFIFGILVVAFFAVIVIAIAGFVMIIKMKKEYKEHIQEELDYRNMTDTKLDYMTNYTDEKIKELRSYIDSRIDKLPSQLNK